MKYLKISGRNYEWIRIAVSSSVNISYSFLFLCFPLPLLLPLQVVHYQYLFSERQSFGKLSIVSHRHHYGRPRFPQTIHFCQSHHDHDTHRNQYISDSEQTPSQTGTQHIGRCLHQSIPRILSQVFSTQTRFPLTICSSSFTF